MLQYKILNDRTSLGEEVGVFSKNRLLLENHEVKPQSRLIKFFDIMIAIIGIFFAFVPMLIIAIAIKMSSKGPIFFIQERLGHYKKPFRLIKFRTMVVNAEGNGPTWASKDDKRVTSIGRFLRKTRLDELPQLINILKGDMGFVGPRPIRMHFAEKLASMEVVYDKRFLVKPGLTGFAQIYAPYGTNLEEQLEKLPYDLKYLNGYSFKDYLKILSLTCKTVLKGNGV